MKKTLFVLAGCSLVFLAGCETTTGLTTEGEKAYFKAQETAASQALFELECPANGCVVGNLKVNNPNGGEINALRTSNPGVDLANTVINAAVTATPWLVLGDVAKTGIENARGDTTQIDRSSRTADDSVTTTQTETTRVSDDSVTTTDNSQRNPITDIDNSEQNPNTVTENPPAPLPE